MNPKIVRRILFITHESSRTGAPIVLLYLLNWIKEQNKEVTLSVLDLHPGILSDDFKKVAENYYSFSYLEEKELSFAMDVKKRLLKKLYGRSILKANEELINKLGSANYDLIYANTIASIPLAYKMKRLNPGLKLIAHIHEMETLTRLILPNLCDYTTEIDFYIAVSEPVRQNLLKNYSIQPSKVKKIYPCTKALLPENKEKKNSIFTIGGAGTTDWPKGYDIFIQIAFFIKNNRPDIKMKFVWMGFMSEFHKSIIENDINKSGLFDVVNFIGEIKNPEEFFAIIDLFLLPSREDSFPLVAIEAGIHKKPIICFEAASGITEILAKGGGEIVSYLDIKGMGEAIIKYYDNPDKIIEDGEIASELFSVFTPENMAPKIFETMERYFYNNRP